MRILLSMPPPCLKPRRSGHGKPWHAWLPCCRAPPATCGAEARSPSGCSARARQCGRGRLRRMTCAGLAHADARSARAHYSPGSSTAVWHARRFDTCVAPGWTAIWEVCSLWCAQGRAIAKSLNSTCGFNIMNSEQGLPLCLGVHVSQKQGDSQTCQACCALGRRES